MSGLGEGGGRGGYMHLCCHYKANECQHGEAAVLDLLQFQLVDVPLQHKQIEGMGKWGGILYVAVQSTQETRLQSADKKCPANAHCTAD